MHGSLRSRSGRAHAACVLVGISMLLLSVLQAGSCLFTSRMTPALPCSAPRCNSHIKQALRGHAEAVSWILYQAFVSIARLVLRTHGWPCRLDRRAPLRSRHQRVPSEVCCLDLAGLQVTPQPSATNGCRVTAWPPSPSHGQDFQDVAGAQARSKVVFGQRSLSAGGQGAFLRCTLCSNVGPSRLPHGWSPVHLPPGTQHSTVPGHQATQPGPPN